MIKPFTKELVLQKISELGPIENVALIGREADEEGGIIVWYPDIGWRETIYEIDGLSDAMYKILRKGGAKRYDSYEQMREDKATERMPGWETCDDYVRINKAMEELAAQGRVAAEASLPAA